MKPITSPLSFSPFAVSAPKQNLRRLLLIRWLVLTGLGIGLVVSNQVLDAHLPNAALVTVLLLAVGFNLLTYFRLARPWPLSNLEFAGQILMDIVGISFVWYHLTTRHQLVVQFFSG